MTLRSSRSPLSALLAATALLALFSAVPARAEGDASASAAKGPPPPDQSTVRVIGSDGKPLAPDLPTSDVGRYCSAIADPAREARISAQTKKLKDLEAQVNARIDELEQKRADYQSWLKDRQAFLDSTSDIMTNIYATMKPDAAALQLAAVDRSTAAALLTKLKPRASSAILSEMPAAVAAELGTLIVAKTGRTPDGATAASGKG